MLEDTDPSIGLAAKPTDKVTLPLSTLPSTLSSDHPDSVSESVRQRRPPARPRRSSVQSMPSDRRVCSISLVHQKRHVLLHQVPEILVRTGSCSLIMGGGSLRAMMK